MTSLSLSLPSAITTRLKVSEKTRAQILVQLTVIIPFLIPISVALSYIAIIPGILFWLSGRPVAVLHRYSRELTPAILFLAVIAIASLFGIAPRRSLSAIFSLSFYILLIPFFLSMIGKFDPRQSLLALMAGQAITSLHTALATFFPGSIRSLFTGAVTESGQLAMVVVVGAGLLSVLPRGPGASARRIRDRNLLGGMVIFATMTLSGLWNLPMAAGILMVFACAVGLGIFIVKLFRSINGPKNGDLATVWQSFALFVFPLLLSSLLFNLKRGPWIGVAAGLGVWLFIYRKRFLAPLFVVALAVISLVAPVRDRLAQSYEHFFILGGRSAIWEIGVELSSRYPLGIGYDNSGMLNRFSPEIPKNLNHFHNNFLNILVELGWLGLAVYCWWIVSILRLGFRERGSPLTIALASALISWQFAGLVEYNFGDSEVLLMALVLIAILLATLSRDKEMAPAATRPAEGA